MRCNYKYILQDSYNDCGLASLATCLLNFGRKVSLLELKEKVKITDKGLSLYQLSKLSKKYNLDPLPVKGNINEIKDSNIPCIAHIIKDKSFFHYIVILKKHKNWLDIFDPAEGIKKMTILEFNQITTNIYLLFNNHKKQKDKSFKQLLKNIIFLYKKDIFLMIIISIVIILITLYINNLIKSLGFNILLILFIMLIFKNILIFYKNKMTCNFYYKLDRDLVDKILTHITKLPNTSFNQKSIGEFSVLFEDIETLKELIIQIFLFCFIDIVILIIITIYLLIYNHNLLLIITVYLSSMYIIYRSYCIKLNDNYQKYKRKYIEFKSELIDKLSGFATMKSLSIENQVKNTINKKNNERLKNQQKMEHINNKYQSITNIINDLIYIGFLLISLSNKSNLVNIIVISNLIPLLTTTTSNVFTIAITYHFYESSFIRIINVLETPDHKKQLFHNKNAASLEQSNYLFSGTLYHNLKLITDKDEDIIKAYNTVFYDKTLSIENLKNILIINNGCNLNENTKNKIILVRLLLSNKKTIFIEKYKRIDTKIINRIIKNYPQLKIINF